MNDLIRRRDAIDALDEIESEVADGYGYQYEKWRKYFCGLPSAQPEQRWIPWDSGRFPDDSGTYIVTAYDGVQERVTFARYQKRLKRWELTGARAYWRVLAWMPLPEPYKG